MKWRPEAIIFSVDDNIVKTVYTDSGYWNKGEFAKNSPFVSNPWSKGNIDAPFDQEFYFIINLAVGGKAFFSDQAVSTKKISINETSLTHIILRSMQMENRGRIAHPTQRQNFGKVKSNGLRLGIS